MRLDVAAEQLLEAERRARRSRPPPRRRPARPRRRRRRRSSRRRGASIRSYSAARSIVRPHSSVGWRSSAVQSRESAPPGAGLLPHLEQLERAPDAGAVARVDRGRGVGRPRGQLGVEPLGAQARRARAATAARDRRVRGRAQLQVGQGGLEVEAGAADDDRAPPRRERRVDLGVGALGELARRERLASGRRTRAVGARARPARRGRGAGELSRGRGRPAGRRPRSRSGPRRARAAARASAMATAGLPHSGGAEQCNHAHGR